MQSPWEQARLEVEHQKQIGKILLAIFATDEDGYTHLIGTAFVVLPGGRSALAVTARHVFDEVQEMQQPPNRSHPSTPAMFRPPLKPLDFSPQRLRALYFDGDNVDACEITWVGTLKEIDVALFSVRFQGHYEGPEFQTRALLDTRPLQVGETVAALSLSGLEVIEQEVLGAKRRATLATSVDLRRGTVTASYIGGGRSPWPAAETTIPLARGMSGGPVFRIKNSGEIEVGACAIVSKDLSEPEAFSSFIVAGHSTLALIWPAVIMHVPVKLPTQTESWPTVLDLIKSGAIPDLGNFESTFIVTGNCNALTIALRQPGS